MLSSPEKPRENPVILIGMLLLSIFSIFVFLYVGPILAIKSLYPLAGLLLALVVINFPYFQTRKTALRRSTIRRLQKLVLSICILSFVSLMTNTIVIWIYLVFLPVGYCLVAFQAMSSRKISLPLVSQLLFLFFISSYSKLETTSFYIGYMDLIYHTGYVKSLLTTGTISAIQSNYSGFPALHIVSGFISLITGSSPHDSIILLGIFSFSGLLVILFSLFRSYILNPTSAFYGTVFLSSSSLYLFYSNYFFPESFAIVLFFLLLLTSLRNLRRTLILSFLVSTTLAITHHFTFVLFLPILIILFTYDSKYIRGGVDKVSLNWVPISLAYCISIYYWGDAGRSFIHALFSFSAGVLSTIWSLGVSTGSGSRKTYLFGVQPESTSIVDAALWFVSIGGVYQVLLVALCALSAVFILTSDNRSRGLYAIVPLAFIGSLLVLDTPITIKSLSRIALPFSIFLFLLIGWGFEQYTSNQQRASIIPRLFLIYLFVSAGALVATNDVYNHSNSVDPKQSSISNSQYVQLESTSLFISQHHPGNVSTFLVMRAMITEVFDTRNVVPPTISNSTIDSSSLVYYTGWSNYRLRYGGEQVYLRYVRISPSWIHQYVYSNNHIYDAGEVGITSSPNTNATFSPIQS